MLRECEPLQGCGWSLILGDDILVDLVPICGIAFEGSVAVEYTTRMRSMKWVSVRGFRSLRGLCSDYLLKEGALSLLEYHRLLGV